jgi:hypothetical protein
MKGKNNQEIIPADIRFWIKVKIGLPDECWEWQARKDKHGYGVFSLTHSQRVLAHRFAYESKIGPIPAGLTIDHLCRNHPCCNPAHMEPVTIGENVRRGMSAQIEATRRRAITHCPQGHPYDAENTYITPSGARACKTCRLKRKHDYLTSLRERGLSTRGHPLYPQNPCINLKYH